MPLYEYKCPTGHISNYRRLCSERHLAAVCSVCGEPAEKIASAFNFVGATYPGTKKFDEWKVSLGRTFESAAEMDRHLKETDTVLLDDNHRGLKKCQEDSKLQMKELAPYLS